MAIKKELEASRSLVTIVDLQLHGAIIYLFIKVTLIMKIFAKTFFLKNILIKTITFATTICTIGGCASYAGKQMMELGDGNDEETDKKLIDSYFNLELQNIKACEPGPTFEMFYSGGLVYFSETSLHEATGIYVGDFLKPRVLEFYILSTLTTSLKDIREKLMHLQKLKGRSQKNEECSLSEVERIAKSFGKAVKALLCASTCEQSANMNSLKELAEIAANSASLGGSTSRIRYSLKLLPEYLDISLVRCLQHDEELVLVRAVNKNKFKEWECCQGLIGRTNINLSFNHDIPLAGMIDGMSACTNFIAQIKGNENVSYKVKIPAAYVPKLCSPMAVIFSHTKGDSDLKTFLEKEDNLLLSCMKCKEGNQSLDDFIKKDELLNSLIKNIQKSEEDLQSIKIKVKNSRCNKEEKTKDYCQLLIQKKSELQELQKTSFNEFRKVFWQNWEPKFGLFLPFNKFSRMEQTIISYMYIGELHPRLLFGNYLLKPTEDPLVLTIDETKMHEFKANMEQCPYSFDEGKFLALLEADNGK